MCDNKKRVAAVIVTYNPDEDDLSNLVDILAEQVGKIYIIDNNSVEVVENFQSENIHIVSLKENMGIAIAQNIGLKAASDEGFTNYVLFDQDSQPSLTMIQDLFFARHQAQANNVNVAAVGPVHIDRDNGHSSTFVRTSSNGIEHIAPDTESSYAECDFLIASGCLISQSALDSIGYMEERLFIDCVDIEWGFRAVSKGYVCIAAFDAKMYHKIGDKPLKLLGRELTIHSPVRHYYFFRNFYHLFKRSYIPLSWKRHVMFKSTLQAVVFCLFLPNRFEHFKAICSGVADAKRNKYGSF